MLTLSMMIVFMVPLQEEAKKQPKAVTIKAAARVDAIVIPRNTEVRLTIKTEKPIAVVYVSNEEIVRHVIVVGQTSVILKGLKPGVARVELKDSDGREDKVIVIVEEPL